MVARLSRKSSRFKRKRSRKDTLSLRNLTKLVRYLQHIEGLEELTISPQTQKFVDCEIGVKISPATPWIFVDKDKIDTHLEFYNEESCFYPLLDEIVGFPKNAILVGSFSCTRDKPVSFYMCLTLDAEERILQLVREQRKNIRLRVQQMQFVDPNPQWESLGSENDVVAEMNLNNRGLFVIDVHAILLVRQKTKFVLRFCQDLRNGYTEMLPGRNTYDNIFRRRIHNGVSCAPILKHQEVQVETAGVYSTSVQYCFEYPEIPFTHTLAIKMRNFLQTIYQDVCNQLIENVHMGLELNDYENLAKYSHIDLLKRPIEIKTYQEIVNCKRKKVSCLSWNALVSGVVAIGYATNPLFYMLKEPEEYQIMDPASETNLILIWDYKDNNKPRLYLHGRAEISALSFCPYNKNILVAGYSSGQIAIWDLTNNLKKKKPKKFLTMREQTNLIQITMLSEWIKKPLGGKHVFPTLSSAVDVSHTSPVTSIAWIPPISFIKGNIQCNSIKFMTSAMDGTMILVWSINSDADEPDTRIVLQSKIIRKYFTPLCQLHIKTLTYPLNNPMLKIILNNQFYRYETLNPSTLSDLDLETNFVVTGLMHPINKSEQIMFTTGLGGLQVASCAGATYETNESLEICSIHTLQIVHDGPIIVCEANAFFPKMILTIGGSVFAIWDYSKLSVPLVWRKRHIRYLSGMWSFHRPLSILLIRIDQHFEYWNFCESSKHPLQVFKYNGYEPINFYGDSKRFHSRKNTFIASDVAGSFKVLLFPSETTQQTFFDIHEAQDYIGRVLELKRQKEALQMKLKEVKEESIIVQDEDMDKKVKKSTVKEPEIQKSRAEAFKEKLEEHGISVLLGLKGLNKKELDAVKSTFIDHGKNDDKIQKKLELNLINKKNMMERTRENLFAKFLIGQSTRRELKVNITREVANKMKRQFSDDYKKVEKELRMKLDRRRRYCSVEMRVIAEASVRDKYKNKFREQFHFGKHQRKINHSTDNLFSTTTEDTSVLESEEKLGEMNDYLLL